MDGFDANNERCEKERGEEVRKIKEWLVAVIAQGIDVLV